MLCKKINGIWSGLYLLPALGLLAVLAMPASAVWQWGSEGDMQCPYVYPEGMLGCRWFNYSNGWVINTPVKFNGWTQAVSVFPLCFQGSVASVMLYYGWPKETHTNGYLNVGDANGANQGGTNNCRLVRIDHVWNYIDIGMGDCQADNPETRSLSGCIITGYCNVAHEISRLYCAVKVGCNYNNADYDNYGPFFTNGGQGFCEILKSRLGFTGAKYTLTSATNAADILKEYIQNQGQPVLAMTMGHCWVLDGYREVGGVKQVHSLNYHNNCNHHTASWQNVTDISSAAQWYIYDLNPRRTIAANSTFAFDYSMGDGYICNTSNTTRRASIRVDGCDRATESYEVTVTSQTRINGVWSAVTTIFPKTTYTQQPQCWYFQTPEFTYKVPSVGTDCIKIAVSIKNALGFVIYPYVQVQEYQVEDRCKIKFAGQDMDALAHGGDLELKTGYSGSPVTGQGWVLSYQGSPRARFASDGKLYCASVQESQSAWLGTASNLTGGLLFKNSANIAPIPSLHVSPDGTMRIGNKVRSPVGVIVPVPIKITGPLGPTIRIGQQVNITWDYDPVQFKDASIMVKMTLDDGRSDQLIIYTAVPVSNKSVSWTVPSVDGLGNPMADKLLKFILEGYVNHTKAISANPIKVSQ
jgi:hypothetical protein